MSKYTPIDEIPIILASLRQTFRTGLTKPLAWRRHQLLQLARFAKENAEALAQAIFLDMGKPKQEVYMAEVGPVIERSMICAENLETWLAERELAPEVQGWQKGWNPRVRKEPKGVVLIISPWNYPMILSLQPLYGAIAAGCCAVIKPSEIAPHYAAFLKENLGKYVDPRAFSVVLGGVPEITRVLELKWDHIFYTGHGHVARIISRAAAEHLTPLTLELGGKSPVVVDASADLSLAAKRILWGKVNNAGQICVTPDFVLCVRSALPGLVEKLKEWEKVFYPDGALQAESGFARIVSQEHFARLKGLLGRTKGKIVVGGKSSEADKGLEPTVVIDVAPGDSLLEGEIFGPILPIMAVENVDEAIDYLNDQDHPLIIYTFTTDEETKKKILAKTTSGGVCFNDTFGQMAVNEMPFGGVGESGYGRQVLKYSVDNFIYDRGVSDVPYGEEQFMGHRYPPYTAASLNAMSEPLKRPIPESTPEGLVSVNGHANGNAGQGVNGN